MSAVVKNTQKYALGFFNTLARKRSIDSDYYLTRSYKIGILDFLLVVPILSLGLYTITAHILWQTIFYGDRWDDNNYKMLFILAGGFNAFIFPSICLFVLGVLNVVSALILAVSSILEYVVSAALTLVASYVILALVLIQDPPPLYEPPLDDAPVIPSDPPPAYDQALI